MKYVLALGLLSVLFSCSQEQAAQSDAKEAMPAPPATPMESKATTETADDAMATLDAVLAAQSDEAKARYEYRNPKETIELFGIEPGMSVAEVLPGSGWYSKILIPYIGEQGRLIGLTYSQTMAEQVFPPRFQEMFSSFTDTFVGQMAEAGASGAEVSAARFGALPEDLSGSLDRVIFVRALHHLSRSEAQGAFYSSALKETFDLLKPGGLVGVVQHEAPESFSDEATVGSSGYVKKSATIAAFEAAGFKLVSDSPINNNAKDVPAEGDVVWRLPPSLRGADDEAAKEKMMAIGETNRMTLVFEKPAS